MRTRVPGGFFCCVGIGGGGGGGCVVCVSKGGDSCVGIVVRLQAVEEVTVQFIVRCGGVGGSPLLERLESIPRGRADRIGNPPPATMNIIL